MIIILQWTSLSLSLVLFGSDWLGFGFNLFFSRVPAIESGGRFMSGIFICSHFSIHQHKRPHECKVFSSSLAVHLRLFMCLLLPASANAFNITLYSIIIFVCVCLRWYAAAGTYEWLVLRAPVFFSNFAIALPANKMNDVCCSSSQCAARTQRKCLLQLNIESFGEIQTKNDIELATRVVRIWITNQNI